MRVGALAKGLLLQGQLSVELVVLCAEKPTYTLLKKIGTLVPEKLKVTKLYSTVHKRYLTDRFIKILRCPAFA